jgi:Tfp pilus assembly protein PilF/DNA-binding transcriptional MerR regulator
MDSYGVADVARMLHLSRGTIRGLISRGFVNPARGPRREYRFSFQDLVTLRAARALVQAKVPARRIGRSLSALRRQLPKSVPLTGFTICAMGNQVVVGRGGGNRWQAESGQYLLELDVSVAGDSLQITEIKRKGGTEGVGREGASGGVSREDSARGVGAASLGSVSSPDSLDAHEWFERGLAAEDDDVDAAVAAYERCRALDAQHLGARINLGRLLHDAGRLEEAQRVYREAVQECEPDPTLFFNLGVLLEDASRNGAAVEAYQQALAEDPDFADAHYNLARLYETLGKPQHAIRHLGIYRRLLKS